MTLALKDVFRGLEAARRDGVIDRYAIGGAVAATFYVEPSATEDVDVFATLRGQSASGPVTLEPIHRYFMAQGARIEGEHLVIADWPVQFLPATTPLVDQALEEALRFEVEGQPVSVFAQEHLAAIALETGRLKDKVRLAQLLQSATFNRARFDDLVNRHHLEDKWSRWTTLLKDET